MAVAVGLHHGAVEVRHGPGRRLAVVSSVQMRVECLRDEEFAIGKLVLPSNEDSLPAPDLERRPRKLAGIAP